MSAFVHSSYRDAYLGPQPVPTWVITEDAAQQIERGILKTGKEADVHLVERRLGERRNLLAAKRYRAAERRQFRDDSRYRQARRTGNRRTDLAIDKGTRAGVAFRAEQWVANEFAVLGRLWSAGVAVPYPVQRIDSELMVEYLGDDDGAAPRLVQVSPAAGQAADLFAQAVANIRLCARRGVVHGDLSPYNMLVWDAPAVPHRLPPGGGPGHPPPTASRSLSATSRTCASGPIATAWRARRARCSQRSWPRCSDRRERRQRPLSSPAVRWDRPRSPSG